MYSWAILTEARPDAHVFALLFMCHVSTFLTLPLLSVKTYVMPGEAVSP